MKERKLNLLYCSLSPLFFLAFLVRREIYCQLQGQCCSEDEEQLMAKSEMKKKKELYDLKKCCSANGIKHNSMKVEDHILRRKGISAITWELISQK